MRWMIYAALRVWLDRGRGEGIVLELQEVEHVAVCFMLNIAELEHIWGGA